VELTHIAIAKLRQHNAAAVKVRKKADSQGN